MENQTDLENFEKFLKQLSIKEFIYNEGLDCGEGCCYEDPELSIVFNDNTVYRIK